MSCIHTYLNDSLAWLSTLWPCISNYLFQVNKVLKQMNANSLSSSSPLRNSRASSMTPKDSAKTKVLSKAYNNEEVIAKELLMSTLESFPEMTIFDIKDGKGHTCTLH